MQHQQTEHKISISIHIGSDFQQRHKHYQYLCQHDYLKNSWASQSRCWCHGTHLTEVHCHLLNTVEWCRELFHKLVSQFEHNFCQGWQWRSTRILKNKVINVLDFFNYMVKHTTWNVIKGQPFWNKLKLMKDCFTCSHDLFWDVLKPSGNWSHQLYLKP